MGHALAAIFLTHGFDVVCVETDPATLATLHARVASVIDTLRQRAAKPLSNKAGELTTVPAITRLGASIRLVVEAVPEDLPLKQSLFAQLEELCPNAVLATNSSVYRVADVASLTRDPSRVIGTHWWNPPHLIPLVEVIQGENTDAAIVRDMMALLTSFGKSPVHVRRDTPGFIGNRLQHALWREAFALVEEGVCSAEEVDLVVRTSFALRLSVIGPLANADFVGLDLTRAIHEYVFPALSTSQVPSVLVDEALAAGRTGAKSGLGLLEWPPGSRDALSARMSERIALLVALHDADVATAS
jgi:3-hydroxybutyryl-CoA dehydrogenase